MSMVALVSVGVSVTAVVRVRTVTTVRDAFGVMVVCQADILEHP